MVTLLSLIGIAGIVGMAWLDVRAIRSVGVEHLE